MTIYQRQAAPGLTALPPARPAGAHGAYGAPGAYGAGDEATRWLKRGIWLYFILLLLEGSLRKWVLPGLAAPLLVVRDPVACCLIAVAWRQGLLPANMYLTGVVLIGSVGIVSATLLGHGSLFVALYGARALLLHFPLIFVIGRVFDRRDVVGLGKVILALAVPMTVLIGLQFYSPQTAWVNLGLGGVTQEGFQGALGYFRPSGTFSFITGTAAFFGVAAAYIFYFWFDRKSINPLLLLAASVALLFAIPLSISRTLFFNVVVALVFLLLASARQRENLGRMVLATAVITGAVVAASQSALFATATTVFLSRFTGANTDEGGLVKGVFMDRFLGGLVGALSRSADLPFFGYGLGMGSNAGSQLLTGNVTFLIAEEEWGRIVGELGPLLGIGLILLRLGLIVKIAGACYRRLTQNDLLPWMLLSFGLLSVAQGSWSQPNTLGFSVLIGGLLIASLRPAAR